MLTAGQQYTMPVGMVTLVAKGIRNQPDDRRESNEMVIAADFAGVPGAIEPSPSGASLRGLDEVNLLLAGALSGFVPTLLRFWRSKIGPNRTLALYAQSSHAIRTVLPGSVAQL
jgi:hypothetical protein